MISSLAALVILGFRKRIIKSDKTLKSFSPVKEKKIYDRTHEKASTTIQKYARRFLAQKEACRKKEATITIQKHIRGCLTRIKRTKIPEFDSKKLALIASEIKILLFPKNLSKRINSSTVLNFNFIGGGTFAKVYSFEVNGKKYALKVFDPNRLNNSRVNSFEKILPFRYSFLTELIPICKQKSINI